MTVKELYENLQKIDDFGANRRLVLKTGKKYHKEKDLIATGLYSDAVVVEVEEK